jgi:hypothetical protein
MSAPYEQPVRDGPNKLCVGCGWINNRPQPFCDRCGGIGGFLGEYVGDGMTKADRAYLEWQRGRI